MECFIPLLTWSRECNFYGKLETIGLTLLLFQVVRSLGTGIIEEKKEKTIYYNCHEKQHALGSGAK